MTIRMLSCAALVTAAAVVAATVAYPTKSKPAEQFEAFFRKALAHDADDPNFLISRVAGHYDVCIYGQRETVSEKYISSFFDMIKQETWMSPNLTYRERTVDCPESTFLYILHHNGEAGIVENIIGDISFIADRAGLSLPTSKMEINAYGLGLTLADAGKEPRAYIALNEFAGTASSVDSLLAHNVVQQEIFQVLAYAPDIPTDRTPVSILEEASRPDVPAGSDDLAARYRDQWAKLNVPNMCLVDIMLLVTLYADDESILDSRLGSYERYIHGNFKKIMEKATRIQNDPDYNDIFSVKC